ncbi:Ig-like domain-containing protein, partial [Tunturiibacter psychrotolerans]
YSGDFQYNSSIGWQTAVVGLKPAPVGPVAFNQAVTVSSGTSAAITLTAQSPGGLPLVYSVVSEPTHGSLTGSTPNLTYTPNTSYTGSDAFTFKANDGTGDSNIATVSLTVKGPNHAPVASNSSVTVAGPTAVMLTATDADGDALTYTVVSPPAHGQVSSGTGPNRTYTPNTGYTGSDTFTFKANDGQADSNVATVSLTVTTVAPAPSRVSSQGYINTTALTTHTTAAFNTVGASTLVMFVGSHSPWNSQPVSISGVSDNLGNSWKVLTGPTSWIGESEPMLGAIYYVNVPATSATHMVTVQLTNPAPLVMHIFAASGSDITGPPIYSAITDPGTGVTSASVITAPITVPADTLLISWVKNETDATATALDGYTLDQTGSTTYLWDETQTALSAGSYSGDFQYNSSIGWQTAVVGLKPAPVGPVAFNQAVTVSSGTSAAITLTAQSPGGLPLVYSVVSEPTHGSLTGSTPNLTYTPNTSYTGSDAFTFKANDGTGDSNIATVSLTVVVQPMVTGVSPNNGPVAGGTAVTITGTNFAPGAT